MDRFAEPKIISNAASIPLVPVIVGAINCIAGKKPRPEADFVLITQSTRETEVILPAPEKSGRAYWGNIAPPGGTAKPLLAKEAGDSPVASRSPHNAMDVLEIRAKSALVRSKIPGVDQVINPYLGCEHGCRYCYAVFMRKYSHHPKSPWGSFVEAKTNIARGVACRTAAEKTAGESPALQRLRPIPAPGTSIPINPGMS